LAGALIFIIIITHTKTSKTTTLFRKPSRTYTNRKSENPNKKYENIRGGNHLRKKITYQKDK